MPAPSISIRRSYALDMANFFSVLTGDQFYVDRHPAAYRHWSDRLSRSGTAAVRDAAAWWESAMLGPAVSFALSALPGFAEAEPAQLLKQADAVAEQFRTLPDHPDEYVQKVRSLCLKLAPVADELADLGFHAYWTAERLPEIQPSVTVRIAIHEMFHPPYRLANVKQEANALMADPLFQESFRTKDPRYGYATESGFLEENIVEAMEVYVSKCAGILADPNHSAPTCSGWSGRCR